MAAKKKASASDKTDNVEVKFSKSQLLAAKRFHDRRDLLNALLSDAETYTVKDVENMIEEFMKGTVN